MKKLFLLLLSIPLFSCSKTEDVVAPVVPEVSDANAIAYFKASLNGVTLDYTQINPLSPFSYGFYTGFQSGPGYFDRSYHYGCFMQPAPFSSSYPKIEITFSNMYNTNNTISQSDAFYNLFAPTPTNFLTSAQLSSLTKGLDVSYRSPNDVQYSSLQGSQVGSNISITSVTNGFAPGTNLKAVTLVGTVNCKLYNYNNVSDVITLTNGKFKLVFKQLN